MREELEATLERLVTALAAHARAAEAGTRPDIPDPLPEPTTALVAALRAHAEALERLTGAIVPWEVVEPPAPSSGPRSPSASGGDAGHGQGWVPDDVDWAGDAERWR